MRLSPWTRHHLLAKLLMLPVHTVFLFLLLLFPLFLFLCPLFFRLSWYTTSFFCVLPLFYDFANHLSSNDITIVFVIVIISSSSPLLLSLPPLSLSSSSFFFFILPFSVCYPPPLTLAMLVLQLCLYFNFFKRLFRQISRRLYGIINMVLIEIQYLCRSTAVRYVNEDLIVFSR